MNEWPEVKENDWCFLSCLCGSEQKMTILFLWPIFLSCLCGSEQYTIELNPLRSHRKDEKYSSTPIQRCIPKAPYNQALPGELEKRVKTMEYLPHCSIHT